MFKDDFEGNVYCVYLSKCRETDYLLYFGKGRSSLEENGKIW